MLQHVRSFLTKSRVKASLARRIRCGFCANLLSPIIVGSFFISVVSASENVLRVVPESGNLERSVELLWPVTVLSDQLFHHLGIAGDLPSGDTFARMRQGVSTSINLDQDQSMILQGAPGETVVLNLKNFVMSDNATLTLQGTATTNFIINVTKQFSLSGSAKIVLSGGVQWDNVRFNVRGKGTVVRLSGQSGLVGILTANRRKVQLSDNSIVRGQVFARRVVLLDGSQIIQPPVASP